MYKSCSLISGIISELLPSIDVGKDYNLKKAAMTLAENTEDEKWDFITDFGDRFVEFNKFCPFIPGLLHIFHQTHSFLISFSSFYYFRKN